MSKRRKLTMPRNRAQFEQAIINAFLAGCTHGYSVIHEKNVYEQEMTGALAWVGRITREEEAKTLEKLRDGFEEADNE